MKQSTRDQFDLDAALRQWHAMKQELKPMLAQLDALEKQVKQYILETGETGDVPEVQVTLTQAYKRETWDGKKLHGYAAAHPEILAFLTYTRVKPSVRLKPL